MVGGHHRPAWGEVEAPGDFATRVGDSRPSLGPEGFPWIALDHEHTLPVSRYCEAGVKFNGNVKPMVAPERGGLSAQTVPPWSCTRCFTMASPSPLPLAERDRSPL